MKSQPHRMKKISTRGGARSGAGRPSDGVDRIAFSARLPVTTIAGIRRLARLRCVSQAQVIVAAIAALRPT